MCKPLTPWERCVQFHGHECGGLLIGYKAAMCAAGQLKLTFAHDEDVVCIAENDACGLDAIQVLLGCSVGKGNLLFHITGKQAFTFFDRDKGRSVRLVLKQLPLGESKEERFEKMFDMDPSELFDVMEARLKLPEAARIFSSHPCDKCGEMTGDNWLKVSGDKLLCLDCYESYDRFKV